MQPQRRDQLRQLDALFQRLVDFLLDRGHFGPRPAIEDVHAAGAEAAGRAGGIYRGVSAADDRDALRDQVLLPVPGAVEKVDALHGNPRRVLP